MQGLLKAVERAMGMREAVWRRHANPWSGLTRFSVLPLLIFAIWSRVWIGLWAWALVAVALGWNWLNPRLFSEPARWDHWMSRGVMGERIYIEHYDQIPAHHRRAGRFLAAASVPGVFLLGWGLWALRIDWVCAGAVLAVLPKVWFVDRMAWLYSDWTAAGGTAPGFEDVQREGVW